MRRDVRTAYLRAYGEAAKDPRVDASALRSMREAFAEVERCITTSQPVEEAFVAQLVALAHKRHEDLNVRMGPTWEQGVHQWAVPGSNRGPRF